MDPRERTAAPAAPSAAQTGEDLSLAHTVGGGLALSGRVEEIGHGQRVGRYVVLGALGAGGMGVVYAAYDPQLDRKVALKLLHSGGTRGDGTAELGDGHARLLREAQAMARLRHPNVVAVHDVGSVGDRVFIAMEFIEGTTLKSWLRAQPRTRKEVLAVFVQAGRGLQAAHEAGLVHRDFKPENVLVSVAGQAQVLDFGLAKSTEDAGEQLAAPAGEVALDRSIGSLSSELTQQGAVLGTPAYMSPEQHLGLPTDARTDQFSFCVALYEALYGTPPFPADSIASLAMAVVGGKVGEAPRDSYARVPMWLRKILLRGLLVDPALRYPSIAALLDELSRDPSSQRRRWIAIAAGVGFVALGAAGYAHYSAQSSQQCADIDHSLAGVWDDATRKAVHEAFVAAGDSAFAEDTWQRAAGMLDRYTAAWVEAQTAVCVATHVERTQTVELLHLQSACLARRLSEVEAVTRVLAQADAAVVENAVSTVAGLHDLGTCTDEQALLSGLVPPQDEQTQAAVDRVRVRLDSAQALARAGQYQTGLGVARAATEEARATRYAPVLAEALLTEGGLLVEAGETRQAEEATTAAIAAAAAGKHAAAAADAWVQLISLVGVELAQAERAIHMRLAAESAIAWAGGDEWVSARFLQAVGNVLHSQGHYAESIEHLGRALALYEKQADDGEAHARDLAIAGTLALLGMVHQSKGEFDTADGYLRRALEIRRKTLGNDHPAAASSLHDLGNNDYRRARYAEAERSLGEALAIRKRVLGPEHKRVADTENSLGAVDYAEGEHVDARLHYARALEIRKKALGEEHPLTASSWMNLGNTDLVLGKYDEARANYEKALTIQEKALGPEHPQVAYSLTNIGLVLVNQDRYEASLPYYKRALAIREKALGLENPDTAYNLDNLGSVQAELGRYEEAIEFQERALKIREKTLGPEHPEVAVSLRSLGDTLAKQGRHAEARERYGAALALREKAFGADHPDIANILVDLAELELKAGGDAVPSATRALAIREGHSDSIQSDLAEARYLLARALIAGEPTAVERARARTLAQAARDGFAGAKDRAPELAKVEAFLARLR
ncbi:MAG: serine/threonine protein kinase [Myxococcales bacterium]|nr:serine/threonine protein kinase [Myxococcales bacterium]